LEVLKILVEKPKFSLDKLGDEGYKVAQSGSQWTGK
jgi:hypothetical protein